MDSVVRIAPVEIQPPKASLQVGKSGVGAWLPHALRTNARPGNEPLGFPVSTAGGPGEQWAHRIVGWYEARRGLEEFLQVFKTGTRIQGPWLRTALVSQQCFAFDAMAAWREFSPAFWARD